MGNNNLEWKVNKFRRNDRVHRYKLSYFVMYDLHILFITSSLYFAEAVLVTSEAPQLDADQTTGTPMAPTQQHRPAETTPPPPPQVTKSTPSQPAEDVEEDADQGNYLITVTDHQSSTNYILTCIMISRYIIHYLYFAVMPHLEKEGPHM